MRPIVSILMTAYNREFFISMAIESVLNSTFKDFELIIVDDCSTDATVAIARKYEKLDSRIKLFVNEHNLGDYDNRNFAASVARGKYIKYVDSDDILYKFSLEIMIEAMELNPDAGFGLSAIGNKLRAYPICISPMQAYEEHFNGFGHFDRAPGSVIIRKKAFDEIGGFKSKKYIGDVELWFLMAQKFNVVLFQRDLLWDRVHAQSEMAYERIQPNMNKLRKNLVLSMLQSNDCPLRKEQIQIIKKDIRNNILLIFKRLFYPLKSL